MAAPSATKDPQPSGIGASSGQKRFTVVLNVTNESSHTMNWIGDAQDQLTPDSPPVNIAPGGTDRIVFESNSVHGIDLRPTWQVAGTQYLVFPTLTVPTIGLNAILCTSENSTKGTPVGFTSASDCTLGAHYHPDAQIVFHDVKQ